MNKDHKICILGLGYVGLPLAVEFSKKFDVVGYDNNHSRVDELKSGHDRTEEISDNDLHCFSGLFTADIGVIAKCNVFIVTVPTPIDQNKCPELSALKEVSSSIGKFLKTEDIVIYESTVFPGVTEDICVPILEASSGLTYLQDFNVGYSPERINPGDKVNTVKNITKLVSASSGEALKTVEYLYSEIIEAGIYSCESIKVAECCKCFENTQRDMNIALMNTLAGLCEKIGIETNDVINAGITKWNFLDFRPGLVGGHCISVDPYYMVHLGRSLGVDVSLIESSRNINEKIVSKIYEKSTGVLGDEKFNVLICGYTFKEDCPDTRNTKVEDLANMYLQGGHSVTIYDPIADCDFVEHNVTDLGSAFDLIIFAVKHARFIDERDLILKLKKDDALVFDLKSQFAQEYSDWRL